MDINSFYLNKKVLITGGAGFIGSHLAEALVKLGAKVTILDNLSSGKLANLEKIQDQINFINGDIRSAKTCKLATQNQNLVLHQAAFVSAAKSCTQPYECYEINVHGTLNILEAANQNKVEKLLFASSAAVYGNAMQACTEDMFCEPESPYGASKLTGEKYCQLISQNSNLQTLALRYFNVWGERQDANGDYAAAIAKFKINLNNNLPVTIYGDGLQTRDFIHVNEVVQANLKLAMLDKKHLNGQAVNIASGQSQTLLDMLATLKQDYPNYQAPIKFMPARTGDIKYSKASNQKLNRLYLEI